jgi:cytochrome o ubiquinol oxidase subunit 2
VLAAAFPLLGGCSILQRGFLNAQGPVAADERHLFAVVVIVMLFVIGPVLLLAPVFAWHYRLSNKHHAFRPSWNFSWPLEAFIWIPPTLIVVGLAFPLWRSARQLDPYVPVHVAGPRLEVQAIAFDWKWLFIYPDSGVAAVNELAIPVGRAVHVTLTSATVMQSLFIPQLAGQIYAMGGMATQLNLAADRTGVFTGENSQFNGQGFPFEEFRVSALSNADFERWVAGLRAGGAVLDPSGLARLEAKSVAMHPVYFSATPPGLFQHILANLRAGAPIAGRPR